MPLLFILAVLVLGWFGWKALRREMARVDRQLKDARRIPPAETLERDPASGRYRPKDEG